MPLAEKGVRGKAAGLAPPQHTLPPKRESASALTEKRPKRDTLLIPTSTHSDTVNADGSPVRLPPTC